MDTSLQEIISRAEQILEAEKQELWHLLTSHGIDEFNSPRNFLMFMEEDAKYRIRSLGLPDKLLQHYLNRVCEIYGPYSEDQPGPGKKYYDNDLYRSP